MIAAVAGGITGERPGMVIAGLFFGAALIAAGILRIEKAWHRFDSPPALQLRLDSIASSAV